MNFLHGFLNTSTINSGDANITNSRNIINFIILTLLFKWIVRQPPWPRGYHISRAHQRFRVRFQAESFFSVLRMEYGVYSASRGYLSLKLVGTSYGITSVIVKETLINAAHIRKNSVSPQMKRSIKKGPFRDCFRHLKMPLLS